MSAQNLTLRVGNLDCEHDAAALKRSLDGFPGLIDLEIYPKAAKVVITYDDGVTDENAIREKLDAAGFPPARGLSLPQPPKPWRNLKVILSVISGVLLALGFLLGFTPAPALVSDALYVAAILIGGYYFGREAIEELIFEREIGIELLMTVAAVVAAVMGQLGEAAMLVFLYSISEAVEGYTEEKTRSAVRALMELAPKTAWVKRDGQEEEIPAAELVPGDVFIVKPGGSIPTDGVILDGSTTVNEAPVTGESAPVEKKPGGTVFAGTINGSGAIEVRATRAFADNTISRIIQMVEEAQERKGKSQRFIERFGRRYSPLVLLAGLLIATLPPLLLGGDWTTWVTRATVFIVAAAPCALVIAIPITLVATLGTGARNGVLIKGGVYVEELAKVRAVALDKTGTLTRGQPEVTEVISLTGEDMPEATWLAAVAGLEARSEHPLAQAILRYARSQNITPAGVDDFQALSGIGAQARWQDRHLLVGSPALFRQRGLSLEAVAEAIQGLQDAGHTVILAGDASQLFGIIAIRDAIRENAAAVIAGLHEIGIRPAVMLTGDNQRAAQAIAREVGVDEVYAELMPEDKVAKVQELERRFGHLAMVGDGVNDAPALATATVGIAMGAAGTDVALETADVALMADDLDKLVYALQLARRNQRVVHQNLILAIAVISLLSVGALAGLLSLPIAVLGHEISEFIVIASGLRMLRN